MTIGFGATLGLETEGDAHAWAVFSPDRRYRYALARLWDDYYPDGALPFWERDDARPPMVWVMLNPSTADHREDDPTIRKCIGFAKRRGCGGIIVVNLFAWRATDPRALSKVEDPVGDCNLEAIGWALRAPLLAERVAGWGRLPSVALRRRAHASIMAAHMGGARRSYGTTKSGDPRHPLMLPYSTPLTARSM